MLATAFALLKGRFDDSDYEDDAEGTSHDDFEDDLEDNFGSLDNLKLPALRVSQLRSRANSNFEIQKRAANLPNRESIQSVPALSRGIGRQKTEIAKVSEISVDHIISIYHSNVFTTKSELPARLPTFFRRNLTCRYSVWSSSAQLLRDECVGNDLSGAMSDVIEEPEAINSRYCGRGGWQGLALQLVAYLGMYNEYYECLSVKLVCNYSLSCTSWTTWAPNTPFLPSESGRTRTQRHEPL